MFGGLFRALRPWQWYKNLLVFLALIFSGSLFDVFLVQRAIIAFISLCCLSSATYLLNDLADRERDRLDPEKCDRPVASGRLHVGWAVFFATVLCAFGFGAALFLPVSFLYAALALFSLSQIYTVWLKHEPFADIVVVATNFVLRAVAGAFAISVWVSPWLISGVFFFAMFLVLGRRRSELQYNKKALLHRPVLRYYNTPATKSFSSVITSSLVISYALFVFFGEHNGMFITLPIVMFAVFRYEHLVELGSVMARHPHRAFKDIRLLFAMLIWSLLVFLVLYYRFVPK